MNDDQCKHVKDFYKEGEDFPLMSLKDVYPSDYRDGWEKLQKQSYRDKTTTKECILQQAKHK